MVLQSKQTTEEYETKLNNRKTFKLTSKKHVVIHDEDWDRYF